MFLRADSEDSESAWANAQADLSLRWAHRSFCWFCHEGLICSQFEPSHERRDLSIVLFVILQMCLDSP